MTKIVYNNCFGGFSLSKAAFARYQELGGTVDYDRNIPRTCPLLVQVVEEMGKAAGGSSASLAIRGLPPGTKYRIDEYDGSEEVMTQDEYEWSIA